MKRSFNYLLFFVCIGLLLSGSYSDEQKRSFNLIKDAAADLPASSQVLVDSILEKDRAINVKADFVREMCK